MIGCENKMNNLNPNAVFSFDSIGIQECQRNRYPLLFIDRVTEVLPGKYAKAIKNFTFNEWFFPAHFDDEPNVPGFVQLEALTQTFLMTFLTLDAYKGKKTSFVSINNCRFKRRIIPGDTLEISAALESFRHGVARGHVESFVNKEAAASTELVIAIPDALVAPPAEYHLNICSFLLGCFFSWRLCASPVAVCQCAVFTVERCSL